MWGLRGGVTLLAALTFAGAAYGGASFVIQNGDPPGQGLNDPTPVAPVGGNPGTTLGEQRLNVVQQAAAMWGAVLNSVPAIAVEVSSVSLACPSAGGPAAQGEPTEWELAFSAPHILSTWYPVALASKLEGYDINGARSEITLRLNLDIGTPDCIPEGFYYGLDGNHGGQIDLLVVVLHELVHGLGFATTTDLATGVQRQNYPSVFDQFTYDNVMFLAWPRMTDVQRSYSARNARNVVWTGANAMSAAAARLVRGTRRLTFDGPARTPEGLFPFFAIGLAPFGAPLTPASVVGQLMTVVDTPEGVGLACTPLDPLNTLAVNGDVAVLSEDPNGECSPTTQVKHAQDAGAIAAVLVAADPANPPADLIGSDPAISIPTVRLSRDVGASLFYWLSHRSRTASGVTIDLGVNANQLRGADENGRPMLYTANPLRDPAHWDTSATPNQLMEPVVAGDVTPANAIAGMTLGALKDIGW